MSKTEEKKKVHNEAAELCKELKNFMKRMEEENKLDYDAYCDQQLDELESKHNVEAVIYVIENCFKPFKVISDGDGKYTIRPMVWYSIANCKPNTLIHTALKLNAFLKQIGML